MSGGIYATLKRQNILFVNSFPFSRVDYEISDAVAAS